MHRSRVVLAAVLLYSGLSVVPATAGDKEVAETPVCYRTESTSPATTTFVVDMVHPGANFTANRSEFKWKDQTANASADPIVRASAPTQFPADTAVRGWATVEAPDDVFQADDELWWTVNNSSKKMAVENFPRECAPDEPGLPPSGGTPDDSDGSSVTVTPACFYLAEEQPETGTTETGLPVIYALDATNSEEDPTEFESRFSWSNPADTLDVNAAPEDFPAGETVQAVVTVVPDSGTVSPDAELTWTIGSTNNTFKASEFTTPCSERPLPSSGSSAVAVIVVTMLVPVVLIGAYLVVTRRRKRPETA